MNNDVIQATMTTWAAKDLPARLHVEETAKLLGFAEHDIQILMASGKLTPLGDPAPNAPKWFAAVEIIRLAMDKDWLHKATKEVSKYWQCKRNRGQARQWTKTDRRLARKNVSPKSSPEPSLNEQWRGDKEAMASGAQEVAKVA
jgi:hypothetical protein